MPSSNSQLSHYLLNPLWKQPKFEFHNTNYEPGKIVGNISREIMQQLDTRDPNVKDYIDFLSSFVYNIINFSGFKCSDKENIFKKVLSFFGWG